MTPFPFWKLDIPMNSSIVKKNNFKFIDIFLKVKKTILKIYHGEDLIVQMQKTPDNYPPFVVIRDKRGDLKITKSSLKVSIQNLSIILERVGHYSEAPRLQGGDSG